MDRFARTMYVKGYLDGYNDGDSAMEKITVIVTKGVPPDASTKALVSPQINRVADIAGLGKNRSITVGTIESAMTTFYSDYRNAPVCWKDALKFAVWSLNGDTPAGEELDAARKRGAESGCK
jgi:hypothetical protein